MLKLFVVYFRTKRQNTAQQFDRTTTDVPGKYSSPFQSLQVRYKKTDEPEPDDCTAMGQWVESKLRMLPQKARCEVTHKIQAILHEAEMATLKVENN